MGKHSSNNIVSIVAKLAQPLAQELEVLIWDISFHKVGSQHFLTIMIDKPLGVTIDDCEQFSRKIDKLLDQHDPIETSYCLEVSSPGIERKLTKPEHFEAYKNLPVKILLIRPEEGQKEWIGNVNYFDKLTINLTIDEGDKTFNFKDIASVRAID